MTLNKLLRLNNGYVMPAIGLGTYLMGGEKLQAAVEQAILLGYRLIDTASSYRNEKDIGATLGRLGREGKISRKDLFITTKVPAVYLNSKDVNRSVEESLDNLKSLYIDLLLVHSPWGLKNLGDGNHRPMDKDGNVIFEHHDIVETWKSFEEQVWSGRVKSIGVSNFTPSQMMRIIKNGKLPPQNAQFECHAYLQQNELRKFCRNSGIVCTSYASLGSEGRPTYHHKEQPSVLLGNEVVADIATKYGKTNAQILLRFLLQKGIAVIPKSEKFSRLEENMDVFDFHLEDTDMVKLQNLDRGLKYFTFVQYKNHPEYSKTGEPF